MKILFLSFLVAYMKCVLLLVLKIAHHPQYIHPLREGHRFPMLKYELIPLQLLHEGLVEARNFFLPEAVPVETLYLAHTQSYVDQLMDCSLDPKMQRRIGFPLSPSLVLRERLLVGGTLQGARYALEFGVSFNTAGGTHHAGSDYGEGFCLFNDQAVAAAFLVAQGLAKQVLIIDLDVHQGNGTAHIFAHEKSIFTFSMHSAKNYPFIKEKSDLDIPLPDELDDDGYLGLLQAELIPLLDQLQPDFIFYQAGVDVLATDKLGKLKLSAQGCKMRDEFVLRQCYSRKIPIQISMGGGYSPEIKDIVNAHVATFRAALNIYPLD